MVRTALHDFHMDLIKNLYLDFVFYIPDSPLFLKALKKIDVFKDKQYFNRLLVIDYYKGPIFMEKARDNSKTIFKSAILEQNIFNLLKKKTELESFEFDYISKKYEEQIESLSYIADWLANNLESYIKYSDDNTKGLFKLQQTNFSSHYSTFLENFGFKKKQEENNPNLEILINNHFEELQRMIAQGSFLATNSVNETENIKKSSAAKDISKNINKTKKQPKITLKEAELSILKSIFNVDL